MTIKMKRRYAKLRKLTFTRLVAFIMPSVSDYFLTLFSTLNNDLQTFFDAGLFPGMSEHQIMRTVIEGRRPKRLEKPKMEDNTWELIQSCWRPIPSHRPTMEEIVTALTLFAEFTTKQRVRQLHTLRIDL